MSDDVSNVVDLANVRMIKLIDSLGERFDRTLTAEKENLGGFASPATDRAAVTLMAALRQASVTGASKRGASKPETLHDVESRLNYVMLGVEDDED